MVKRQGIKNISLISATVGLGLIGGVSLQEKVGVGGVQEASAKPLYQIYYPGYSVTNPKNKNGLDSGKYLKVDDIKGASLPNGSNNKPSDIFGRPANALYDWTTPYSKKLLYESQTYGDGRALIGSEKKDIPGETKDGNRQYTQVNLKFRGWALFGGFASHTSKNQTTFLVTAQLDPDTIFSETKDWSDTPSTDQINGLLEKYSELKPNGLPKNSIGEVKYKVLKSTDTTAKKNTAYDWNIRSTLALRYQGGKSADTCSKKSSGNAGDYTGVYYDVAFRTTPRVCNRNYNATGFKTNTPMKAWFHGDNVIRESKVDKGEYLANVSAYRLYIVKQVRGNNNPDWQMKAYAPVIIPLAQSDANKQFGNTKMMVESLPFIANYGTKKVMPGKIVLSSGISKDSKWYINSREVWRRYHSTSLTTYTSGKDMPGTSCYYEPAFTGVRGPAVNNQRPKCSNYSIEPRYFSPTTNKGLDGNTDGNGSYPYEPSLNPSDYRKGKQDRGYTSMYGLHTSFGNPGKTSIDGSSGDIRFSNATYFYYTGYIGMIAFVPNGVTEKKVRINMKFKYILRDKETGKNLDSWTKDKPEYGTDVKLPASTTKFAYNNNKATQDFYSNLPGKSMFEFKYDGVKKKVEFSRMESWYGDTDNYKKQLKGYTDKTQINYYKKEKMYKPLTFTTKYIYKYSPEPDPEAELKGNGRWYLNKRKESDNETDIQNENSGLVVENNLEVRDITSTYTRVNKVKRTTKVPGQGEFSDTMTNTDAQGYESGFEWDEFDSARRYKLQNSDTIPSGGDNKFIYSIAYFSTSSFGTKTVYYGEYSAKVTDYEKPKFNEGSWVTMDSVKLPSNHSYQDIKTITTTNSKIKVNIGGEISGATKKVKKFTEEFEFEKPLDKVLLTQGTVQNLYDSVKYDLDEIKGNKVSMTNKNDRKPTVNLVLFEKGDGKGDLMRFAVPDLDLNLRDKPEFAKKGTDDFTENKYVMSTQYENIVNKGDTKGFEVGLRYKMYATKYKGFLISVDSKSGNKILEPSEVDAKAKTQLKGDYSDYTGKLGRSIDITKEQDELIIDPTLQNSYYLPVDAETDLIPDYNYSLDSKMGYMGLNDLTVTFSRGLTFQRYLLGSVFDDPWIVEQKEVPVDFGTTDMGVDEDKTTKYAHTIEIDVENGRKIAEKIDERNKMKKLFGFRSGDGVTFYESIKGLLK